MNASDVQPKLRVAPVDVPAWPEMRGKLFVREMTAKEAEDYEAAIPRDSRRVRAARVAFSACDADGQLLFRPEDIDTINGWPLSYVQPIFDASLQLVAGSIEDAEKN